MISDCLSIWAFAGMKLLLAISCKNLLSILVIETYLLCFCCMLEQGAHECQGNRNKLSRNGSLSYLNIATILVSSEWTCMQYNQKAQESDYPSFTFLNLPKNFM